MRVANPNARTFLGPGLVEPVTDPEEFDRSVTTRKFDVAHYEKTRELIFLEEGTTVPTPSQIENGKKMREEIQAIEQLEKLGGYKEVSKKYKVSIGTAHSHMMSLRAKAKREAKEEKEMEKVEMIQGPSSAEVEQFFTDDIPQGFPESEVSEVEMNPSETYHVPPEEQNEVPVESNDDTEGNCPKRGIVEPQGMTEEENMTDEEWEARDYPNEMDMLQSAIDGNWDGIEFYLANIRKMEIALVDKRIKAKLQGMVEGMA